MKTPRTQRIDVDAVTVTAPAELNAPLSSREMEVVRLLAEGLSNKQIGANLGLSHKTVKNHVSHILGKVGLNTRTQVAILALRGGIGLGGG